MSRKTSGSRASFSPTQRKACAVLAVCVLAVILTFIASWVLPGKLSLGGSGRYDPQAYPLDTSLGSVLAKTSDAGTDYVSSTLFVGDQFAKSLYDDKVITLDQFAGKDGLTVSSLLNDACVYFAGDSSAYTVPQAVSKMNPRRVVMLLGSNDLDGSLSYDNFARNYKQAVIAITGAYQYCDVIVCAIPPVAKNASDAAKTQLMIDQFNQELAKMCNDEGYKYLNLAEALKDSNSGYAEATYLNNKQNGFSTSGANVVLNYLRNHAYDTADTRPNTDDIPQRTEQAGGSAAATEPTPSATPTTFKLQYLVEEGKGTLQGNDQSGVTSIEMDAAEKQTVTITAVAADGYTFYKWSDGLTTATRVDSATKDISVTAMFNDARVQINLDQGESTIKQGESLTINASVTLGGKSYDNSGVQWSVNDDMMQNGASYTFTPNATGDYRIKAGLEVNGTYTSQELMVHVQAPATTVSITGVSSMPAGSTTTLQANVSNPSGDTTWTCAQKPQWSATGDNVQFSADTVGSYTVRAANNGQYAELVINVTEPLSDPTVTPEPSDSGDQFPFFPFGDED